MNKDNTAEEIAALKDQAASLIGDIRNQINRGVELKPEVRSALMVESNEELKRRSLDDILKDKGVSRAARRKLAHMRRTKQTEAPAHTQRAQAIADRLARERLAKRQEADA